MQSGKKMTSSLRRLLFALDGDKVQLLLVLLVQRRKKGNERRGFYVVREKGDVVLETVVVCSR